MSLKKLVDADCGGANALMKLASYSVKDNGLQQEGLNGRSGASFPSKSLHGATSDQLAQEFLQNADSNLADVPQTFDMKSLLQNIKSVEESNTQLSPAIKSVNNPTDDGSALRWAHDFNKQHRQQPPDNYIWSDAMSLLPHKEVFIDYNLPILDQGEQDDSLMIIEELESQEAPLEVPDELRRAARDLVHDAMETPFAETKFMKFIETLSQDHNQRLLDNSEGFSQLQASLDEKTKETSDIDFWDALQKDLETMSSEKEFQDAMEDEFRSMSDPFKKEYAFGPNPYLSLENSFEEGLKKLQENDIPSAVLLFEANIQKYPDHMLGWQYLGTTQAENERDSDAIIALKNCLNLEPNNLTALMSLATCYTNESFHYLACVTLSHWLQLNSKYNHLLPVEPPSNKMGSLDNKYSTVQNAFLRAANMFPSNLDPEVQCGLGILFNVSGEYDKAADCFRAALQVRPKDSLLWNRLGASLANGRRTEEAVNAYNRALELSPGFIRSRFNLGISCINLGAHREAVEHFLTALNLQASAPKGITSENIWNTLRTALAFIKDPDLTHAAIQKDIKTLNKAFKMDS